MYSFKKLEGQNINQDSNGWRNPSRLDTTGLNEYLIKEFKKTSPPLKSAAYLLGQVYFNFLGGLFYIKVNKKDANFKDDDNDSLLNVINQSENYITRLPQLESNPNQLVSFDNVGSNSLMPIWDLGVNALPELKGNKDYLFQLYGLNRIILQLYLGRVYRKCHHSFTEKEKRSFRKNSKDFLDILYDLNTLISLLDEESLKSSLKNRLKTFNNTDSLGRNGLEYDNASLKIQDIIKTLFIPRWIMYREYIQECLDDRKKPDIKFIYEKMRAMEKAWANQIKTENKPVKISLEQKASILLTIYNKYKGVNFRVE